MKLTEGRPIIYRAEFAAVAAAGGSQTQTLSVTETVVVLGILLGAYDAVTPGAMAREGMRLGLTRSDDISLTTGPLMGSLFGTGERPFNLAGILGQYRLVRGGAVTLTIYNDHPTLAMTRAHVALYCRAQDLRLPH